MNSSPLVLEVFQERDDPQSGPSAAPLDGSNSQGTDVFEAVRMKAYEQGYSAGWEDASKAALEEQNRIGTELGQNLLDMNFTFHEAKSHVIRSVVPVLDAMISRFLPAALARQIGPVVLEEILPLVEQSAETPIAITVAPGNAEKISPVLQRAGVSQFEIIEEPSLGSGQVRLQSGRLEKLIDPAEAVSRLSEALNTINEANRGALSDG